VGGVVTPYDEAAATYDGHFARPVDRWEDDLMEGLFVPLVEGRRVLDLGCGTGWVADHCDPPDYTGVDCSGPMLAELGRKHANAVTVKATVGEPGWWQSVGDGYDAITATWSLEYLGELAWLLVQLKALAAPGAVLALHGSLPRGHRRAHFSVKDAPYLALGPHQVKSAASAAGLRRPLCIGTSALPDAWAGLGEQAWRAALRVPAGMHYSAAWLWRLP
jgi:predicted TPR repeat methyltransferase